MTETTIERRVYAGRRDRAPRLHPRRRCTSTTRSSSTSSGSGARRARPADVGRGDLARAAASSASRRARTSTSSRSRASRRSCTGATWVLPDDVKEIFCDTARHRIARTRARAGREHRGRRDPDRAARRRCPSRDPRARDARAPVHRGVHGEEDPQPARRASTRARCAGRASTSTSTSRTAPATTCGGSTGTSTARMNAPFVRQTHAERELNVMIAMDLSRSMDLGTAKYSKKEALTFITGVAAVLGAVGSDQHRLPRLLRSRAAWRRRPGARAPRPGRRSSSAGRSTRRRRAPPCCRRSSTCVKTLKRMSVVFLVSDFMTDDDVLGSKDLAMLAARHDVIAVVPEDPAETALPAGRGYLRLKDLESGRQVVHRAQRAQPRRGTPKRSGGAARRSRGPSTACRWITCSCRRIAVPSSRCCRCLPRGLRCEAQ